MSTRADRAAGEENLRLAIEASDLGLWDYDITTGVLRWSARQRALYGLGPDAPLDFATFVAGIHPEDRELVLGSYQRALDPAGDGRFGFEHRTVAPDGTVRWLLAGGQVVFDAARRPLQVHGTSRDITARRRMEDALRESEAMFRNLAESLPHMVWVMRHDGFATFLNRRFREYHGFEMSGTLPERAATIHPDDRASAFAQRDADVAAGRPFEVEVRTRRRDGLYRWHRMSGVPVRLPGQPDLYICTAIDIDDLRRAEQELKRLVAHQEFLIHELNHRVKNTLAIVQAIAAQTLRGNERDAREGFQARLIALAGAYDVLTRENWQPADLHHIVAEAIAPHTGGQDRFAIGGPPARVTPVVALPLAMALHELCTNAAKYGALSAPEGRVRIGWTLQDDAAATALTLEWRESGGPPVKPPTRAGFGTRLLERAFAGEAGGRVELRYEPEGLVCRMRVPLADAGSGADA